MAKHTPIKAADLRHSIRILYRVNYKDQYGDETVGWEVRYPLVYAAVHPVSGKEFIAAQQVENKYTYRFTIRYKPFILESDTVEFRGKQYNIEAVLSDQDSGIEYLTLLCSEGTSL